MIGPNGAGKTTLMRVISGLIRPTAGAISMEGIDVADNAGASHRQSRHRPCAGEPPAVSAADGRGQSQDGRLHAGRARANTPSGWSSCYDLFPRMKERRSQLAGTMSGGEQQMCAIGRALMSNPKLLLLDEPSAGLAPVVVQQVFELVKRIRASGLTVLIVEQNVQQVLRVVDRAYLLEAGSIRASGTSAELRTATPSSRPISGYRGG